ncbi:MAG: helix-turn-helix domain-containing protein [Ktedonobacteraceae bacterium]|nr:helix-turn-helix domain-containing protein [Ktedonobacteraceae bacterium]
MTQEADIPPTPLLLTLTQTCKVLNLGKTKIYELMATEGLPCIRFGKKALRFSYVALQEWIVQRSRQDVA